MLYHILPAFTLEYFCTSLGHAMPSVEIGIEVPFGYSTSNVSLKTVYATIPQGLAVAAGSKAVPLIERFLPILALVTMGLQAVYT